MNGTVFLGTIIAVFGDNLGSHQIGGFTENFSSSQYFCRYCYIKRNDLNLANISPQTRRTLESYETDISALNNNTDSRGMKQTSCFNQLQHYQVCNPGLPSCIAPDIFEGIIPFDLMYILYNLVEKGYITYNFLNASLRNIRLENDLNYKIPLIKKMKKKYLEQLVKILGYY